MKKYLILLSLIFGALHLSAQNLDTAKSKIVNNIKPTFIFLDTTGIKQTSPIRIEIPPSLPADVKIGESYSFINKKGLDKFIYSKLNYPKEARKSNIQGTVIVSFVVERDGSISNIQIVQSVSPEIDTETLRLIKGLPHWTPAIYSGRSIRSVVTIPVLFSLERKTN